MSKTLRVVLDPTADPQVQVDPIVLGQPKLKWRRNSDSMEFDFVGISGLPASFVTTKSTRKKINVTNGMVAGDYDYIIAVRAGGVTYTSTVAAPPASGPKPVIRNLD